MRTPHKFQLSGVIRTTKNKINYPSQCLSQQNKLLSASDMTNKNISQWYEAPFAGLTLNIIA